MDPVSFPPNDPDSADLDPTDWDAARAQAHRMLDDILDHVQQIRGGPVWQPIPDAVRLNSEGPCLGRRQTSLTSTPTSSA
jgi:hypothetical protein